jgi:hypothetical protein
MKEGPSGSAIRSLIPSHRELLRIKAVVVSVADAGTMIPTGMVERGERKRTAAEASKFPYTMSKPGAGTPTGTSLEDVLIPTQRHPACRQREARSGFGTERDNLAGDAKRKGASGCHREAESTDAPGGTVS